MVMLKHKSPSKLGRGWAQPRHNRGRDRSSAPTPASLGLSLSARKPPAALPKKAAAAAARAHSPVFQGRGTAPPTKARSATDPRASPTTHQKGREEAPGIAAPRSGWKRGVFQQNRAHKPSRAARAAATQGRGKAVPQNMPRATPSAPVETNTPPSHKVPGEETRASRPPPGWNRALPSPQRTTAPQPKERHPSNAPAATVRQPRAAQGRRGNRSHTAPSNGWVAKASRL